MYKYCHYCVTWIVVNLSCQRTHSVLLGRQPHSSALGNTGIVGKQIGVDFFFLGAVVKCCLIVQRTHWKVQYQNEWKIYEWFVCKSSLKEQSTTMFRICVIIPPFSIALRSCGTTVIGQHSWEKLSVLTSYNRHVTQKWPRRARVVWEIFSFMTKVHNMFVKSITIAISQSISCIWSGV